MTNELITTAAVLAVAVPAGCMGDDEGADGAAVGGLESGVSPGLRRVARHGRCRVSAAGITVVGMGTATASATRRSGRSASRPAARRPRSRLPPTPRRWRRWWRR